MARFTRVISPEHPEGIDVPYTAEEEALADAEATQSVIDGKEYVVQEYARNRKEEYDALNQFELISDDDANGTTIHKDAIAAIKTKWPKDNSGPIE